MILLPNLLIYQQNPDARIFILSMYQGNAEDVLCEVFNALTYMPSSISTCTCIISTTTKNGGNLMTTDMLPCTSHPKILVLPCTSHPKILVLPCTSHPKILVLPCMLHPLLVTSFRVNILFKLLLFTITSSC